jgi:hypothetical protein
MAEQGDRATSATEQTRPGSPTDTWVDDDILTPQTEPDTGTQLAATAEPGHAIHLADLLDAPETPASVNRQALPPGTWPRRVYAITCLFIATLVTLLGVLLIIASATEDAAIENHTGHANAEVISVAMNRTLVRFQTSDGAEHMPSAGVLYPEALEEGQVVRVEYDTRNPDLVRVAGRGATLTVLPVVTTLLAVWAVAGGLTWWIRRKGPLFLRSMRARRV